MENQSSYFDGGLLSLWGYRLLTALVTAITLGIAYPWAQCKMVQWRVKHTVVNGRRLRFTGTGMSLFGHWIKWWLLSLITLGIYALWLPIKMQKWEAEHTFFAD
ncbi:MAG: DUF898 family protein [Eubacteriales bacterium]|nr:DUF898 family protein [Eubacteriales bacterium]